MKSIAMCALRLAGVLLLAAALCPAAPVFQVFPALAPNAYGSPSYDGWVSNAIYALEHGLTSYGTPGMPTYYSQASSSIPGADIQVTSFYSWMGQANPGTVFGPAFASELGNRLSFGFHVDGDGALFCISQLSFTATSGDPGNQLGFTFAAGSYNYNAGYVGLNYGPDGVKGTADDFWVNGGVNTQLVNELFGRGSGNAYWPCEPDVAHPNPCPTDADKQAALDASATAYQNYPFSGIYTLNLATGQPLTGSASVDVNPNPEPATWLLCGGALMLAGLRRTSRRP